MRPIVTCSAVAAGPSVPGTDPINTQTFDCGLSPAGRREEMLQDAIIAADRHLRC